MSGLKRGALAVGAAVVGGGLLARKNPSACPYSQRWILEFPRPFITIDRLKSVLEPRPGERLLELGPGPGKDTLPLARTLEPDGSLDAFDLQQEMLDDLMRRAADAGVGNITPTQGDARELPYEDATFDGAFLVTVLGEIPDQLAALRELQRVLKPGGRAVFGETVVDPHFVTIKSLTRQAEEVGLRFDHRLGPAGVGYIARFVKA